MNKIELFNNFEKELKFSVTIEVYNTFQLCSGDKNYLHTDEEFAKAKGFRERVMYGNILNTFLSYSIGMALPTPDVMIQTQDIQYKRPVFLNDELTMNIKVDEIHKSVNVVQFVYKFFNQENKVVAKGHVQIGVFES
jgi:3-hydroxybutyryl-CoA dehydratase